MIQSGSGGESVSQKAAGQLPRSGPEWRPAYPTTLLKVRDRANKTTVAVLLQHAAVGNRSPKGIGHLS